MKWQTSIMTGLMGCAALGLVSCSGMNDTETVLAQANSTDVVEASDTAGTQTQGLANRGRITAYDNNSNATTVANNSHGSATYYFDFDKSAVHQADIDNVMAQARYLASHPQAHILLAGHTDERGSREYNVALGDRRARALRDMILTVNGVDARQIRIVSYGEEKPAALGHNENAYRQNRRVQLSYRR